MTREKLDLEDLRQRARDERTEKRIINKLEKVHNQVKPYFKKQ